MSDPRALGDVPRWRSHRRCGIRAHPTTGRCWLPSTASSQARATQRAMTYSDRRRSRLQTCCRNSPWKRSRARSGMAGRGTRAFGAKPQRTRDSLEALMRRASSGLPRVNRLTDLYNAVSILHQLPCGGEDLTRYSGPPRLLRAAGTEPFDTVADGTTVIEHPEPGEVIWCDDAGVTCRRWNWRQAHRTQLRDDTTTALFILDALDPLTDKALHAAGDDLIAHLTQLGADEGVARRLLSATTSLDQGA